MAAEEFLVKSHFRYLDFAVSGIKNFQKKDSILVNRDSMVTLSNAKLKASKEKEKRCLIEMHKAKSPWPRIKLQPQERC